MPRATVLEALDAGGEIEGLKLPGETSIARQMLAKRLNVNEMELEKKGVTVISAGSFALPGARAAAPAIEALREIGVDLSRHRSRPLYVELIHQADIIYTMSRSH